MGKREEKDRYGYPLAPRKLPAGCWFYEERTGIRFFAPKEHEFGVPVLTWKRIEAALRNHRAAKRRKPKR